MNKLTLENKRDFPMTTNALKFMQDAYAMLEKLAAIGGDNYIVSECVVTGLSVSSGHMVLKGRLMPFKAGSVTTNVQIIETKQTITVEGGSREEISYHAEFGTSSNPDNNIAWASIKRINTIIELMAAIAEMSEQITGLDGRVETLESKTLWLECTIEDNELADTLSNVKQEGSVVVCNFAFRRPVGSTGTGSFDALKLPSSISSPSGTSAQFGIPFCASADDVDGSIRCKVNENGTIRIFGVENMNPGSYYHGSVSYIV